MNELYLLNGILLIITGVVLGAYHTYASGKMAKALKMNKTMLSEAVAYIILGGFYVYCCIFMEPIMTSSTTTPESNHSNTSQRRDISIFEEFEHLLSNFSKSHLENNLKLIFPNKNCDFKLLWMEYSSFLGSFSHTLISIITTFLSNSDDISAIQAQNQGRSNNSSEKKNLSKSYKMYLSTFLQWLTPVLSILLFYYSKDNVVNDAKNRPGGIKLPFIPTRNTSTAINTKNLTEITKVVNKVYKIMSEEIMLMSYTAQTLNATTLKQCFMKTNFFKIFMLNLLFLVYLLPIFVFTIIYLQQSYQNGKNESLGVPKSKLNSENLRLFKSSFVWALILQSPAFLNTFFDIFLNSELKAQDKLSQILITVANLFSMIRLKQGIQIDNMKMAMLYSVKPSET